MFVLQVLVEFDTIAGVEDFISAKNLVSSTEPPLYNVKCRRCFQCTHSEQPYHSLPELGMLVRSNSKKLHMPEKDELIEILDGNLTVSVTDVYLY